MPKFPIEYFHVTFVTRWPRDALRCATCDKLCPYCHCRGDNDFFWRTPPFLIHIQSILVPPSSSRISPMKGIVICLFLVSTILVSCSEVHPQGTHRDILTPHRQKLPSSLPPSRIPSGVAIDAHAGNDNALAVRHRWKHQQQSDFSFRVPAVKLRHIASTFYSILSKTVSRLHISRPKLPNPLSVFKSGAESWRRSVQHLRSRAWWQRRGLDGSTSTNSSITPPHEPPAIVPDIDVGNLGRTRNESIHGIADNLNITSVRHIIHNAFSTAPFIPEPTSNLRNGDIHSDLREEMDRLLFCSKISGFIWVFGICLLILPEEICKRPRMSYLVSRVPKSSVHCSFPCVGLRATGCGAHMGRDISEVTASPRSDIVVGLSQCRTATVSEEGFALIIA